MRLAKVQDELRNCEGEETGSYVVEHDAGSFRELFEAADRPWFEYVEEPEEDQAKNGKCGSCGETNEGEELASYLVDDDVTRVFSAGFASYDGCGWNSDHRDDEGGYQGAGREDK
jgi:hypothetical protein